MRQVLKRLQVPLPYMSGFSATNDSYSSEGFFKVYKDYGVPHDPMRYQNEKFFGTHLHRGWSHYIGPDSMMHWIIKKSWRFTNVRLYRISASIRAYVLLILSSQASVRLHIIGNMASALTAQKPLLNNFEDVVNSRVDIWEDIKHYQDTLIYASSKVNYSMGEGVYMLPSDMNLNIRSGTAGYNNKILVSDGMFSLGRNNTVDAPKSHRTLIKHAPMPKAAHTSASTHQEKRVTLVLVLTSAFRIWYTCH